MTDSVRVDLQATRVAAIKDAKEQYEAAKNTKERHYARLQLQRARRALTEQE